MLQPTVVEKPPIAPKPTKLVPVQAEQPKPVAAIPTGGGGGGGDPMAELRAKLANRSTIAPGEMAPIKKEPVQLKPVAKSAEDVPTPTASGPCLFFFYLLLLRQRQHNSNNNKQQTTNGKHNNNI